MRHYTQLTKGQRYQISVLKDKGFSQTEIAKTIGVHKSTISRELKRNTGKRGYRPKQAHRLATQRAKERNHRRLKAYYWSIVDLKQRVGDWELDTVIGKNHQQALVTLVERKTKTTFIKKVEKRDATSVGNAIIELLKPYSRLGLLHTLTADNGKEFADHQRVAQQLNTDFYFADPYASWQRGLNENTNGLIRQYCPKGSSFSHIDKTFT